MPVLFLLLFQLLPAAPLAGSTAPEIRCMVAFTHVAVAAAITTLVHQGRPQQVRVEMAPEGLARLETRVDHDKLRTRDQTADAGRSSKQPPPRKVTVHVTMPTIRSLYVANGNYLQADTVRGNRLWLEVNQLGQFVLRQVQAKRVSASTTSTGRVVLHHLRADTLQSAGAISSRLTVANICPYYRLALGGHVQTDALAVETCTATLCGRAQAHASSGGLLTMLGNSQLSSRVRSGGWVQQE